MESAFKQKGTELLKLEKYTEAIDKYTEALNIMNERINRNEINTEKDMFQLIEKLKVHASSLSFLVSKTSASAT